MSGNFTQRGEAAVFHKSVRARHAVENGADAVLELPAVFAVAPRRTVRKRRRTPSRLSLPSVSTLAFGCESGEKRGLPAHSARHACRDQGLPLRPQREPEGRDKLHPRPQRRPARRRRRRGRSASLFPQQHPRNGVLPRHSLGKRPPSTRSPSRASAPGMPIHSSRRISPPPPPCAPPCATPPARQKKAIRSNLPESVLRDAPRIRSDRLGKSCPVRIFGDNTRAGGRLSRLRGRAGKPHPRHAARQPRLQRTAQKKLSPSAIQRHACGGLLMQNFLGLTRETVRDFAEAPPLPAHACRKKKRARNRYTIASSARAIFPAQKRALACFETDVRANDLYNVLTGTHTGEFETQFV